MTEVNAFRSEAAEVFGTIGDDLEVLHTKDLLGSVITVNGYKLLDSEHNDDKYAVMDISTDDGDIGETDFIWNTGSGVIRKQLHHNRENLPFKAGLEERQAKDSSNTYLTFTSA